jgi:hypothetical protein
MDLLFRSTKLRFHRLDVDCLMVEVDFGFEAKTIIAGGSMSTKSTVRIGALRVFDADNYGRCSL